MSYNPHVYPEGCFFNSIEDIKDKHLLTMKMVLSQLIAMT